MIGTSLSWELTSIVKPSRKPGEAFIARGRSIAQVQGTTSRSLLAEAQTLCRHDAYTAAIERAERVLNDDRRPEHSRVHFDAHYLMAQAYANVGQHDKAARCCQQALALAHVAEEQGDLSAAKNFWKKVLYLSPSSMAAYLELGALYEREHDTIRAQKMRATALELLTALPPHAPVQLYAELTAVELAGYVQRASGGASDV
jgi:chemotaxis protein methyltransferase CheR